MKKIGVLRAVVFVAAMSAPEWAFAQPCSFLPGNAFQNCGFETGGFDGWITQDLAMPLNALHVGMAGEPMFGFTSSPTEGIFAALHGFDGATPGHIRLAQDVTVPGGGVLVFDYRVAWTMAGPPIGNVDRTFDVVVEPAGGGAPLSSTRILTAQVGTSQPDIGNLPGAVDLRPFEGQAIRVVFDWFVPEPATGPAGFQIDNVRLTGPPGYFSVSPCRVLDTRDPMLGGALAANTDRIFTIAGRCNIPPTAKSVSVNLAVTQPTAAGNLRLYPAGVALPLVSSINYRAGQTRSNNAIVPLSALGQLAVHCAQASGSAHFILDVNGYFQ